MLRAQCSGSIGQRTNRIIGERVVGLHQHGTCVDAGETNWRKVR